MAKFIIRGLRSTKLMTAGFGFSPTQPVTYTMLQIDHGRGKLQLGYGREAVRASYGRQAVQIDHERDVMQTNQARQVVGIPEE